MWRRVVGRLYSYKALTTEGKDQKQQKRADEKEGISRRELEGILIPLNDSLAPLGLEVRHTRAEHDGRRYWALCSTEEMVQQLTACAFDDQALCSR